MPKVLFGEWRCQWSRLQALLKQLPHKLRKVPPFRQRLPWVGQPFVPEVGVDASVRVTYQHDRQAPRACRTTWHAPAWWKQQLGCQFVRPGLEEKTLDKRPPGRRLQPGSPHFVRLIEHAFIAESPNQKLNACKRHRHAKSMWTKEP